MSLSLQMLSSVVGKDSKTLSRWCEAGLVPGAYRLRGGEVRRGKWRVRFPRASQQDLLKARYHAKRAGVKIWEYAALCSLERLVDRIAKNTRHFRRERGKHFKADASDMALAGNVFALNQRVIVAEMARLAAERAIGNQSEGSLWADAVKVLGREAHLPLSTPAGTGRARLLSHDWLDLARGKARLMLQAARKPKRRSSVGAGITLPMLCRSLGLPMPLVRKDARLAELLERQVHEANRSEGVEINIGVLVADDEHKGKTQPVRDFSPMANKMYRDAAEEAAKWLRSMTPDQRALMDEETFAHISDLAGKANSAR